MNVNQPSAEAIAVKDGKIFARGSLKEVVKAAGKGANTIVLKVK